MTCRFQPDFDLQSYNSMSVPSRCRWFASVSTREELRSAVAFAKSKDLPLVVIGSGTNLLLADMIDAVIVKMSILGKRLLGSEAQRVQPDQFDQTSAMAEVAAGENWHEFVHWCLRQNLYGLENLALIPGTCGAAPIQNIGAYGVELDQFVESVEIFDLEQRQFVHLTTPDCKFGYRDSIFKRELRDRAIIVALRLELSRASCVNLSYPALGEYLETHQLAATPENVFTSVCAIRKSKLPDPDQLPNVGSFFKNPVILNSQREQLLLRYPTIPCFEQGDSNRIKIPAAWLIEQAGWRGKNIDGVGVHDKQALVLVNPAHKPISSVLNLAGKIQADVLSKFGIELELEPRQIS